MMTNQDDTKQPESAETTPTRFVTVDDVRFFQYHALFGEHATLFLDA
jgi:hypothetical protein